MKVRTSFQVFFLLFAVLGVFYPVLFGEFNYVDDLKLVRWLENTDDFDLVGFLRPGSGFYYRPLLMWTFIADKYLWGLLPSFMHLENLLLHAFNTLLVFFIARKVFQKGGLSKSELPFFSALLFALHPINTESVNWISGRSDLLAAFFCLSSTLILIQGLDSGKRRLIFLSVLFLVLAIMSKEVSIFFFPVGGMLIFCWEAGENRTLLRSRLKDFSLFASPLLAGGTIFLISRWERFGHANSALKHLMGYSHDLLETLRIAFMVFGFYVKKLFLPLPLNFAIREISEFYILVGVLSLSIILALWIRLRKNLPMVFFSAGIILITPGILIVLARVAWTPVAERYLFLPSAFFAIGIIGLFFQFTTAMGKESLFPAVISVVLVGATVFTVQRNLVWQDNLTLYEATLRESPGFTGLRNDRAVALAARGEDAAALAQIKADRVLDQDNPTLVLTQALLSLKMGDAAEARKLIMSVCPDKSQANTIILKALIATDEFRLQELENQPESMAVTRDLLESYDLLYKQTHDPFLLYRRAQLFLFCDKIEEAAEHFSQAFEAAPKNAYYKDAAGKLASNLSSQLK